MLNGGQSFGVEFSLKMWYNTQLEIKNYILSLNKNIKIEKTREILDGKEIDLYLPEYNLGIEFNGSMFHVTVNSVYDNVDKLYHFNKFKLAKEKGVHLINIFDVDWESNKEKIKMFLKSLLTKNKMVYARKCVLVHVDYEIYKDFCDKYHLQGASRKGLSKYIYRDTNAAINILRKAIEQKQVSQHKSVPWDTREFTLGENV